MAIAEDGTPWYGKCGITKPLNMNPLQPSPQLLCKLGSAIVHADEMSGPHGHEFDKVAFQQVLNDPEVKAWIEAMTKMAMLPVKRNP